jgi:hypothetical protein
MGEFLKSFTGRLMALSIGIALVGGGASALMHHGVEATFVMCLSLFAPIVVNAAALPSALEEHWESAVLAVIALPCLMLLWAVGVGVMREFHPELGGPVIVAGLAAFVVAAWPAHHTPLVTGRTAMQH